MSITDLVQLLVSNQQITLAPMARTSWQDIPDHHNLLVLDLTRMIIFGVNLLKPVAKRNTVCSRAQTACINRAALALANWRPPRSKMELGCAIQKFTTSKCNATTFKRVALIHALHG